MCHPVTALKNPPEGGVSTLSPAKPKEIYIHKNVNSANGKTTYCKCMVWKVLLLLASFHFHLGEKYLKREEYMNAHW